MADNSRIEWTEATWNPVTGCSKVSQGCKNCYALRDWPRLAAPRPKPNIYTGRAFTDVRCHPERLGEPWHWRRGRRVFVNSMSDLFHESVPFEFIASVFAIMGVTTRHTYQVLTKRPQRMLDFFAWVHEEFPPTSFGAYDRIYDHFPKHIPWEGMKVYRHGYDNCGPTYPFPNVWLGVSVEDQDTANERIPLLLQTPAAVRWISAEPLLGPIDLEHIQWPEKHKVDVLRRGAWDLPGWVAGFTNHSDMNGIDWVVVGGESGPNARPMHPDWARWLRNQCQAAGVPFFFKQWGEWANYVNSNEQRASMSHWMLRDGRVTSIEDDLNDFFDEAGARLIGRVGKKAAGRTLDGRTWEEYPTCPA